MFTSLVGSNAACGICIGLVVLAPGGLMCVNGGSVMSQRRIGAQFLTPERVCAGSDCWQHFANVVRAIIIIYSLSKHDKHDEPKVLNNLSLFSYAIILTY